MFYMHGILPSGHPEYDCSSRSIDEWSMEGTEHVVLGLYYIITGVIILACYTLVILALNDHNLLKESCYRIMFYNCFFDMGNIVTSSLITGYLLFNGSHFCSYPILTWIGGTSGLAFWCGCCVNCIALGFNRISIMTQVGTCMFRGKTTYLWMMLSVIVFAIAGFYTRPPLFNSTVGTWLYTPMIDNPDKEKTIFHNYFHAVVNIGTALIITMTYVFLIVFLLNKQKKSNMSERGLRWESLQKRLMVQTLAISFSTGVPCFIYIYMQFVTLPIWFYMISSVGYQIANTCPLVVYLTMNKDINYRIKVMFGAAAPKLQTASFHVTVQ